MDGRRYARWATHRAVYFTGKDIEARGRLINISLGGCAVESTVSPDEGAFLQLEVNVSIHEAPMVVALAPVRWAQAGRFGMEFVGLDGAPQLQLRRFVDTLKTGEPSTSPTAP